MLIKFSFVLSFRLDKKARYLLLMITKEWSLQDAKNKFSAVVDAAKQGKAQIVTRRGVPTAAVVSMADFEKLQQLESQELPCFIDLLLSMPADNGEFARLPIELRDFN